MVDPQGQLNSSNLSQVGKIRGQARAVAQCSAEIARPARPPSRSAAGQPAAPQRHRRLADQVLAASLESADDRTHDCVEIDGTIEH